ncbi:MAG TPA: glycosyltransferase [Chitinophagaceae bacterium]|nr:glycosyltransferase [Chitinophagaceae bacterium]HPH31362.1 glycosyltransferase [Chitinophagaceae bacterium]
MISVIIPALNEGRTIGQVVRLATHSPKVSEVIVVDDNSSDNTVEEAKRAGATVITSARLGKGTSMREGLLFASNPYIVFLDADITTYPANIIQLMTTPLITNRADFCKTYFSRQAGRVTELLVKPLLSILYPSFPLFIQPLSGMIAGKRDYFESIEFEDGYGVDIGILIDMHQMGARIREINIGHIENAMHPLEELGKMSREVATVILKKCVLKGRNGYEAREIYY